jgi:hypothetical protein
MDYAGFIRLIQFFDNSLFKMLKDFVPARANLSTGVTISSPILERNKFVYANPSSTSKLNINEGTIEGPTIKTEYTNLYTYLPGNKAAYYNGEIEGDIVNYNDIFNEVNFNPYLEYNTARWNSLYPSDPINLNSFAHSNFNVLLNNVSQSRLSNNRKILEAIYTQNSSLRLAGYSSSYYAELQDSYETLKTHQDSRYNGSKLSGAKYNIYTSGDMSHDKSPVINHNSKKIAIFTEISSSVFLPKRNRVSLKYLVDQSGSLTELNQRNKRWEEVQRTFVAGDYVNVSQFDNQKYSNQKTTDGNKLIFDSGYSYYPILYFASCSIGGDPKIYFENLGGSNAYLVTANNGPDPRTISGSGTMTFPIASSNVYKIFNTEIDSDNIFTPGTAAAPPTYSVQESGDHRVEASFNLTVGVTGGNNLVTGSLIMLKNGTPSLRYSEIFDLNPGGTTGSLQTGYFSAPGQFISSTLSYTSIITTGRSIFIGGLSRPAGTTLYKYTQPLFGTATTCNVSNPQSYPYYSFAPGPFLATNLSPACANGVVEYNVTSDLYYIDSPELPSLGEATKLLYINRPDNFPVSGLVEGDEISFILNISSSNNNFTASISQGSLAIGSLAASTGYASTVCPYFHSASISRSIVEGTGSTNIITFPIGLSNFYSNNYQFVPNPFTGSLSVNSLYSTYGDVDYPLSVKPFDIALTYLSDGTYVENRIISSSYSGSFFRIHLDTIMSNQYVNNIMSGSYQRFLLLSRVEDETSAYLTFNKRQGKTSYGFLIPQDIADDYMDNIDTITKEVKQKLLADQQGTTS